MINTPVQKPQFKHDCEQCTYIGRITHHGDSGDGYVHDNELVIRLGNEPDRYASRDVRMAHAGNHPETDGFPRLLKLLHKASDCAPAK